MRGKRIAVFVGAVAFLIASATSARSAPAARRVPPPTTTTTVARPTPTTTTTTVASRGVVALTFDDGPGATFTPQVLDVLDRYGVKANFFLVGAAVGPNAALVRRMVREGHVIGNHTWDHVALPTLDAAGFVAQVDRTDALLRRFSDDVADCVRPPFGKIDDRSAAAVRSRGLRVERWTQDSEDWKHPGVAAIVANVLAGAEPGAVVLLHDGGPDASQTVAALPAIIEGIRARGLSLAPTC